MAHTPLRMTIDEAHTEVKKGWSACYSGKAIAEAVSRVADKPMGYRLNILVARLCFRGIYFPQMGTLAWLKVFAENWRTIGSLSLEGFGMWFRHWRRTVLPSTANLP